MGYQALLFCPDEKTARTVTQVLGELDFTVVPCTEPFGAVKKLMAERFDAVVVDCDNEQNATLLFKSARNTADNQSSLAVAVVEGQAGVAKAFRIGANLVLTKPINVEQAKGTLRVARGLLRKGEASKSAPVAAVTPKSSAPIPAPATGTPQAPVSAPTAQPPQTSAPVFMAAKASSGSASNPAGQKSDASLASEAVESDDIFEVVEESLASPAAKTEPASAPKITTSSSIESKAKSAVVSPNLPGFSSSAASAPAPARETAPSISARPTSAPVISEPEIPDEEAAADLSKTSVVPASFTFGGNVSEVKPSTSGSKKVLIAIAAVVLIAIAGYATWMQFGRSNATTATSSPVTRAVPAPAPQVTSSTGSAALSTPSPAASSTQNSTVASDYSSHSNVIANAPADTQNFAKSGPAPITGTTTASTAKTIPPVEPSKLSAPAANKIGPVNSSAPVRLKNGSSDSTVNDAPSPSLTGIVPTESSSLPNLIAQGNAPTPVLQTVNISQGVSQGLILKKVQPAYSANALRLRIEGPVQLLATISKSGEVSIVKVVSGDRQLASSAIDAVKQWKYKPYLLNGSPVEVQTQITINFKLPH